MDINKQEKKRLRRINCQRITVAVKKLFIEANTDLGADVVAALKDSLNKEESAIGRQVIEKIIENADIACLNKMPICQDTGLAVVFVELGQDIHIVGGDLRLAIEEGVGRPTLMDICANLSVILYREKTRRIIPRQ